ncbi:MAG: GIY-YIG nuclease family protein [Oscillospiraceae bacterium]|nr:GIY-YIG nuclease family protein [Oscillospiraceae bacterium]
MTEKNYVYLLRCADDSLYCGWTTDLEHRVRTHNAGQGAKYTRSRLPAKLVYWEVFEDRREALSREWHLKRLSREEKLELVEGFTEKEG